MEDLNNVPSSGTYGAAINEVNANFSLVVNAINSLEYATTKSKGIYNNGFTPNTTTLPNSVSGDWCMVLGTGNTFPATIWTFNGTTWAQGGTWNPDGLDLTGYATTAAMNTAIANSLLQATARMGYGEATASNNAYSVTITGYTLPTKGGVVRIKMPTSATGAATLNITDTGAKTLWYNGAAVSSTNTWAAQEIISVFYDGTIYMASNSQGGGGNASKIKYDNSQSGLAADNVQEALSEVYKDSVYEEPIVAPFANIGYFMTSSNTYASHNTYKIMFVPVTPGCTYKVTAGSAGAVFAVVKDKTITDGRQIPYATGYNGRQTTPVGTSMYVTIPSDGHYLCVATVLGSGDVRPELRNVYYPEYIAHKCQYEQDVSASDGIMLSVYINGESQWDSRNSGVLYPLDDNVVCIDITQNSTNGTNYAFLSSSATDSVHYSECCEIRGNITVGSHVTLSVPIGAKFFYLLYGTSGANFPEKVTITRWGTGSSEGGGGSSASGITEDIPQTLGELYCIRKAEEGVRISQYAMNTLNVPNGRKVAGDTFTGLPYSSTRVNQTFVPNHVSYETYLSALTDTNSYAYATNPNPGLSGYTTLYYGMVCGVFACLCLGIKVLRHTNRSMFDIPGLVKTESQSPYSMRIGYIINAAKSGTNHAMVCIGIQRNNGVVSKIRMAESIDPVCRIVEYTTSQFNTLLQTYTIMKYEKLYENLYNPSDSPYTTYVYNKNIMPKKGNKSNWSTYENVIIDVLDSSSYTGYAVYKDGAQYSSAELTGNTVNLGHLPFGKYKMVLTSEEGQSAPVEWIVVDMNMTATALSGGKVRFTFSSANATPISAYWTRSDYMANLCFEVTQKDIANGYMDTEISTEPSQCAGISGYTNSLYETYHDYYAVSQNPIYPRMAFETEYGIITTPQWSQADAIYYID